MPSIYDLKPRFQKLLQPTIRALASVGVTPNLVTAIALIGSIITGFAVGYLGPRDTRWLLLLPVWLFLRMALNAIDGMMARQLAMTTRLGGILNEVGDVVSDTALYLPLIMLRTSTWPIVLFAFGAVLTEFCGVLGMTLDGKRHYEGPMGKSDRAFFIGALALLTVFVPRVTPAWPWLFALATLLTGLTCWNRLASALRSAPPPEIAP